MRNVVYSISPRRILDPTIEVIASYHVVLGAWRISRTRKRRYQPFRPSPSTERMIYSHHVDDEARTE